MAPIRGPRGDFAARLRLRATAASPAARDEDEGVDPAEETIEPGLRFIEGHGVDGMGDREADEKGSEDGELAQDEDPHHGVAGQSRQRPPIVSIFHALRQCHHASCPMYSDLSPRRHIPFGGG
jgi:hypothetical protein